MERTHIFAGMHVQVVNELTLSGVGGGGGTMQWGCEIAFLKFNVSPLWLPGNFSHPALQTQKKREACSSSWLICVYV